MRRGDAVVSLIVDRFVITSRSGQPTVSTSSEAEARHYARLLGGTIIDKENVR